MRALDRKMLRDLRHIWAQALAIALVLGCGVMVLVMAEGASRALTDTRDAYYERSRFADVFATATRAPRSLATELARIPGVAAVEARITFPVILDVPGLAEPATGRVLSLPPAGPPVLNIPVLRSGRWPDPLHPDEVALSESFALANNLRPGDSLSAVMNGKMRVLTVSGTMLSPEFIYLIAPGGIMPDDRRHGVIWMAQEAAAAATDLQGAFNEVTAQLTPDAIPGQVIAEMDLALAPYGGSGAFGRDRQTSHAFLKSELEQLSAMVLILPPVFLIVAAFLVNMVLGRLIALERPQIGLLKAIGYGRAEITAHYLKISAGIGVLGVVLGWAVGVWLGQGMTRLYADFYRFPFLIYAPGKSAFAISAGLAMAAVLLGALRSVAASGRLSPAVAMLPPVPPLYRRGWLDRMSAGLRLRQTTMMILRSITRWPGRAAVTMFGVAASVSVLIASFFTFDSVNQMVDELFTQSNRQHMTVVLSSPRPRAAEQAALALPGVLRAEGGYGVPVRLSHGAASRLVGLEARSGQETLVRLMDGGRQIILPPAQGLTIPETLAEALGAGVGDRISVAFLVPPRRTHEVQVSAVIAQSFGETVYLHDATLAALLGQAPQINRVDMLIDPAALPALYAAIKRAPGISGVALWSDVRQKFDATMNANLLRMVVIFTSLGIVITVGVVYNAARIQLAERAHELASLRVLGFTRAEVGYVLVGELMLLTLLALPLGWLAGHGFAALVAQGFSTEMVRIPLVIAPATYGYSSVIVAGSALGAALVVRRRLDRVNIAMALKQRE